MYSVKEDMTKNRETNTSYILVVTHCYNQILAAEKGRTQVGP